MNGDTLVPDLLSEPTPDSSGAVADNFTLTAGTHLLTLTATDSTGLTGTDTVSVSVNAGPTAPVVSITPSAPTTSDDLAVSIDTPSTDPDGGPSAIQNRSCCAGPPGLDLPPPPGLRPPRRRARRALSVFA